MTKMLQQIQDILEKEDIEGLIALGAPRDEYNAEAEILAKWLSLQKKYPNSVR